MSGEKVTESELPDSENLDLAALASDGPGSEDSAFSCPVTWSRGQKVLHAAKNDWYSVAQSLLEDGYRMCVDLTAVDFLTYKGTRLVPASIQAERFEVVAMFANFETRERLRIKTQVQATDLTIDSLHVLYPGTDFMEREVFDMFGIVFDNHPDMSRVLMPETWVGHPLRKDYAIGAIPVQFKGVNQ